MKKITFGNKEWEIFTSNNAAQRLIPEALKIRGYSEVTIEDVPDEAVWGGGERITVVSGALSPGNPAQPMYFTADGEADEKVRDALAIVRPGANLTSVFMDRPE